MIGEQINVVIENLCQKFGATQEVLVPEMAKFCTARAWVNAAFCGIVLIFCIVMTIVSIRKTKEDIDWFGGTVIFSGVAILFFVGLWWNISEAIQWQAAPTAKAIEYTLQLLKN